MMKFCVRAGVVSLVVALFAPIVEAASRANEPEHRANATQDASVELVQAESIALDDIVVGGVRQAYRGNFELREIPRSINTVDAETLEENAITGLTEALDLDASVARQNTLGGLWDSFAIRGFAGDENLPSGYLVNGFNAGRGFGGQRDLAGIERVEILKGPAAALYGRGEPGGTVNLVTKQARLGETFGTVQAQTGSFDTQRAEADINLPLGEALAVRLIGYGEQSDGFRDFVAEDRWGFLPSLGWAINDATRLTYDLEKTRVSVPFDRGIVVLDDNFKTVPRDRFLGEPGDGDHVAEAEGHQLRLSHDFSPAWRMLLGAIKRDTLLTGTSSDPELAVSRQPVFEDGQTLARQRRSRVYDSEQLAFRGELDGEFQLGSFWHRLLIGADYDRFKNYQDFRRVRPARLASNPSDEQSYAVDIDNPVYGRFPLPTPLPNNDRLDIQESIGVFVQDQVELTERLQLRLGARYDDYELRTENYITDIDSERQEGRLSPQLGVVYELSEPVVLYANYGEGFRANIGTDVNGNIFDPEETRAVEAGAKLALFDGAIDATVAVFSQEKKNVLASDINNPGFSAAIGKARSRGVELDVSGELPAEVEFRLSYAYTDAEARSSVLDPNFSFEIKPGDPLANIPDHQFNAQAQKRFTVADKQTMAGAGLRYVSERLGATGTDFTLPDYTLFRLFGDVQLTDNLAVFANIDNVFNTHWYASSYSQLWVQPGTPRTATVGLRATF